jgi:hypothetical protein
MNSTNSVKSSESGGIMQAHYVSVWDDVGEIRTSCKYNPTTNSVFDVETSDIQPEGVCEREYIELFDGTTVDTFVYTDNGLQIISGQAQEDYDRDDHFSKVTLVAGVTTNGNPKVELTPYFINGHQAGWCTREGVVIKPYITFEYDSESDNPHDMADDELASLGISYDYIDIDIS